MIAEENKEETRYVGLTNHLFGQKTPAEAAQTAVKKANDKVEGDRLMSARRQARVDTAEQKIPAINAAKAAARAAHDATESEEPFDPAPFDVELAKWEAELQSRIEVRGKQDEVLAASRAALADAALVLRVEQHKEQLAITKTALRTFHEENKKLAALEGDGVSAFSANFTSDELVDNFDKLSDRYLNPPPRPTPPPDTLIWFIKPWSDGGRQYNPQEGASFSVETCIEIAACGAGEIVNPSPDVPRRVEEFRKLTAAQKRYETA